MPSSRSESPSVSPAAAGSDSESPAPSHSPPAQDAQSSLLVKKRPATAEEPKGVTKVTKRRAARACASCRARKVRCDVVEGAPCGNCRWDNVECIVQESRRRKKHLIPVHPSASAHVSGAEALRPALTDASHLISAADQEAHRSNSAAISLRMLEERGSGNSMESTDGHAPHGSYEPSAYRTDPANQSSKVADGNGRLVWPNPMLQQAALFGEIRTAEFLSSLEDSDVLAQLPAFVRPLPDKIVSEDVRYLRAKGALTLPDIRFQSALLRAFVEYVYPYMPILELHDFLNVINATDGMYGQVSLLLYQAVMFSATAFVDTKHIREAGFMSRRAARKAFFQRTRLLYDFDYESDRLVLVQALLLMTYWYETPDDQKDTWHWMGVAVSLAHTIGLHRNPATMSMLPRRQKLGKRIWWSCFMRDRLIALGMRRPTRIKDEDFDVPMLEEDDFEIDVLPAENQLLGSECPLVRDVSMQRDLAMMCIEKAKLCVCISHMLLVQYSMLNRDGMRPENTTNSTMMLFPNKSLDNVENVSVVDEELIEWQSNLPGCCQYRPLTSSDAKEGKATIAVQRNLLHMVYQTTVSALHRPQFLPASPLHAPKASVQAQEMSRMRVRDAAIQITSMAAELHQFRLERLLPTTGVTVILPAMIIHLLEMKSALPEAREKATKGFRQCMRVMEKLREMYAAADFATGFLEAALRKAAIDMHGSHANSSAASFQQHMAAGKNLHGVLAPGLNLGPATTRSEELTTPPPDEPGATYLNPADADLFQHGASGGRAGLHRGVFTMARAGQSPPQSERDFSGSGVTGTTPSASGSSEGAGMPPLDLDFDFAAGAQEEFDWTALTGGAKLDFDQWLQFPAEAVNNSDDPAMMGMLGGGEQGGRSTEPGSDALLGQDQDLDTKMSELAEAVATS